MSLRSASLSAGVWLGINVLAHAQPPPFQPSDLNAWRELSDPRITPDGAQAVYVETLAGRANLWLASTDGKIRRALTTGPWRDSSPRWSPDGARVAYLSDRAGAPQIRIRAAQGEEDRPLATPGITPLAFAWSLDGTTLALTGRVSEPSPDAAWAPPALLPQLRTIHTRLFLIPAARGELRPIPLGQLEPVGEPAWSVLPLKAPHGGQLVVALSPPLDPARPLEGPELYAVSVPDFALRQLTHHPGPDLDPLPSPDGSRLAWIAREPSAQSYVTAKLWVANPDGSRARPLAGALDRDPVRPQWSSDSRTLYFLAEDSGATHVYAARNDGGARRVTPAPQRLHGFALADNGRAVAVRSPGELVTFPVDVPGQPVVLAAPNAAWLAAHPAGAVEALEYRSGDRRIEAWITKPPGFDPARKYPLLLDIEDSPPRMCGGEFRLRAQILAAAGFIVLCANPRGTPGYGEAFGSVIRTAYPEAPFDDLMAGVQAVAARPYIDPARIAISGGVLAAWALGHSDRFHAAVARRPIADFALHVAISPDGARRAAAVMGALPWVDPDQYVRHSPIYFAAAFRTPTLILAGSHDPAAQELYFALRMRGVASALVHVEDPVAELEAEIAWLKR